MSVPLLDLPVLVVDCQSTGGSPRRGHLLDLGWCVVRAADAPPAVDAIHHHLARLPHGASVPRPITRLTGITTAEAQRGRERDDLWRDFRDAALPLGNGTGPFCVAHYARFEEGFLRALHAECAPADPFPLRFLCTHEISRRLFPNLPRRGLRVVAGLFGAPAPELKRARDHVAATAAVWSGLVRRLREERGVITLDDLRRLIAEPPRPRRGRWEYPLPRETRLALPDRPGVYRFLGADGTVLYVGKARSLRARVNSYYRHRRPGDKVLELVSQAVDVDVTVTASALEAAVLEAAEIQRLAPRYNHALRVEDSRVWFLSGDFGSARSRPDRAHRRGPFPDRRPFAAARALAALLGGERPRPEAGAELLRALDLPGRGHAETAASAAELLAGRHGLDPARSGVTALLALGRRLARERAASARIDAEAAGEDQLQVVETPSIPGGLFGAESADRRPGRTPEGMADWLESTLVHGARLVRRARWFPLLATSTLCWRPTTPSGAPPGSRPRRRALVLERASISLCCNLLPGELPPLPRPGSRRPMTAGCSPISLTGNLLLGETTPFDRSPENGLPSKGFDRAAYDRLRVLTTEIRRLIAEGREVELHLPPRAPGGAPRRLGTRALRRILERV